MLHELREFCEDNNRQPPGPWRSVAPRTELTYWFTGDPALEIEAQRAAEIGHEGGRRVYLQRVVHDLRYLLVDEHGLERERGSFASVDAGLALATGWLSGLELGALDLKTYPRVPLI